MCEAELSFSYSLFVHNPKSVLLAALTDNKSTSDQSALVHNFSSTHRSTNGTHTDAGAAEAHHVPFAYG